MNEVAGCLIESELHQGHSSTVLRARRIADGARVVLKLVRNEFPNALELARFEREFKVAGNLDLKHTVKLLELARHGHRHVLIYQDDDCISLRRYFGGRALDIASLLDVAVGIARGLVELHHNHLVHHDINPSNVLIQPQSRAIKLTDLELARTPGLAPELANRAIGTLAYLAPEQSGRTSAGVDHRADLYSFGATLYELACACTMFPGLDDASLLHAHFALTPISLAEHVPDFPPILEALIARLTAKSPVDRYQTARSVLNDLDLMAAHWKEFGALRTFALGNADHLQTMAHAESLYGREAVSAALLQSLAAAKTSVRPIWLALHGLAGCGKSSQLQQFADALPAQTVLCLGRCERLEQNSPYAALVHAFRRLLRSWLGQNEQDLLKLRASLKKNLGINAGVLATLLPDLEKIMGPAPKLMPLGASAEQARFQLAVRGFLQIAVNQQAPLVIALDDLQWADAASLQFVEKLLSSDLAPCVVVTAARDEEGAATLTQWRAQLAQLNITAQSLHLAPLSVLQIANLVSDGLGELHGGEPVLHQLVGLIQEKTHGNPFFVRQFLQSLVQAEVLRKPSAQALWQYDDAALGKLNLSDNVLKLLGERISALGDTQRQALQLAACIGQHFDLDTLGNLVSLADQATRQVIPADQATRQMSQLTLLELRSCLDALVDIGILATSSPDRQDDQHAGNAPERTLYKFTHARVREAAFEKIHEHERAKIHLKIGRLWHQQFSCEPSRRELSRRNIFDVVGQLNRGMTLLDDDVERTMLSALNAQAASEARQQSAYDIALEHAGYALSLLPTDGSSAAVKASLETHVLLAECQASAGDLDAAVQVFEFALSMTTDAQDSAHVLEKLCEALQSSGRPAAALEQVQRALATLNAPLILPPASDTHAMAVLNDAQNTLVAQLTAPETLTAFARLGNADARAAQISRLYDKAIIGVYFTRPELLAFVTARSLAHVLNTGWTPEAGIALGWWTMILAMFNRHALGAQFAELAISTHARFGNDYYGGGAKMLAQAMSLCWTVPYKENYDRAGESYQLLHQSGNLQFASYGLITQHISNIVNAADVAEMLASCERWAEYCERYVPLELGQAKIRTYCLHRLMDTAREQLDCEAILKSYEAQNNATDVCESLTEMARTAMLLDEFANALSYSERADPMFTAGAAGTLLLNYSHLFVLAVASARMARLALVNQANDEHQRLCAQYLSSYERLAELSRLNTQNFYAYEQLARAEGAMLHGDKDAATIGYLAAIRHARLHGYTLLQAQATQYLAEAMRLSGDDFAHGVERDAEQLYRRSACIAKVRDSQLTSAYATPSQTTRTLDAHPSSSGGHGIDLLSVLKANEAIASEIDFDLLLTRLLAITVENTGAKRGLLILLEQTSGAFFIEADSERGRVHEPLAGNARCPAQMINYVARSGFAAALDDGSRRSAFREDPYFAGRNVRSVIACPILRQGQLRGVVYLENDSVIGAFGYQRLEMINMLLGSAAIALENAALYRQQRQYADELEQRVRERTTELEQANLALARLAEIDGLTQIANRRQFDLLCQQYEKDADAIAVVLCDVDDFKAYNDHYGHPAGDEVLRRVARAMCAVAQPGAGLLARYGGEEFVVLIKQISAQQLADFADALRLAIQNMQLPHGYARASAHVSISIGTSYIAASCKAQILNRVQHLIGAADRALYEAKRRGRNQVVAEPAIAQS